MLALLPNQIHLSDAHQANAEALRFVAEKRFTHKETKQEYGRRNLKSASTKARGSGYLWDEAEAWGAWGKVTEHKKKVR